MLLPEGVKILVKMQEVEEITEGGIIIPETVKDKRQVAMSRGTIVAIGPLAQNFFGIDEHGVEKTPAKVGDKVICARYGGASFQMDVKEGGRRTFRFINDEDIICKGWVFDDIE